MHLRRSRHTTTPLNEDDAVVIDPPTARDRDIFDILYWHRALPTSWIHAHFVGEYSYTRKRCGQLKEDQNRYLLWPERLNPRFSNTRHGIYALAHRGAQAIGRPLPRYSKHELPHELIVALHECALKFQARAAGRTFSFFDETEYRLPSGATWRPDGHPIVLGDGDVLIHSEIERRKYNESPKDTEEKIDKAHEYVKLRLYQADAKAGLVLFLSTSAGRTETLKRYVAQKYGSSSFLGFATTKDWADEARYPDPAVPLAVAWERVGYPPLKLFEKGGA